jgi:cytosine/uracil/thiamine/allantoin permease
MGIISRHNVNPMAGTALAFGLSCFQCCVPVFLGTHLALFMAAASDPLGWKRSNGMQNI